jgi:hypothetical protein
VRRFTEDSKYKSGTLSTRTTLPLRITEIHDGMGLELWLIQRLEFSLVALFFVAGCCFTGGSDSRFSMLVFFVSHFFLHSFTSI